MEYGYKKQIILSFEEAVLKAKVELTKEGFGVLTEIDVKMMLKKKLNVEFGSYVILGACNPSFAHQALQTEREIGLLMPCNVIVYESENKIFASVILPTVAMSMIDNPALGEIAKQVEEKLKKVVNNI